MCGNTVSVQCLIQVKQAAGSIDSMLCWHDFQSRSKKKHSIIKQSMGKTGGGTMNTESLTTQEEVLDIMCSTSIDGHPEIEESTVNILQLPEVILLILLIFTSTYQNRYRIDVVNVTSSEQIMEVEYLDEDEENISQIYDIDTNSNECNIVTSQKRKSNMDKECNNLQKVVSGKENIDKTSKNYKIIRDNQQCTTKFDKSIEKSGLLQNNANFSTQNEQNNNEEQTPFNEKKGRNTRSKQLQNTIEISTHLNNIYDKTYDLKKNYYESKIKYLKRFVEATEKVTNIFEQYFHH
ncbi:GATOR2 complex protein WDR24-like [Linepithema humile]|uniref:GATOR2 complex protein WDR24-like n=1 Tax=Linepithema humile TaxID=83485 RepID=UPI00351E62CF